MQTTYTVIRPSGSIDADGLDLISAVQWLLGYDGHDFELRPHVNDGAYALFVSRMSHNSGGGNGGMVRADIPPAFAQNEEDAWPIIAAAVLRAHHRWKGCEIMTDAEYAASAMTRQRGGGIR